jgi:peptidoglycan hydrolase CwlO-like protein
MNTIQKVENVEVVDSNLETIKFNIVTDAPFTDGLGTVFPAKAVTEVSIHDYREQIKGLEKKISDVDTFNKGLQNQIAGLNATITENENSKGGIKKQIEEINIKLEELTAYANSVKQVEVKPEIITPDPVIEPEVIVE